MKNKKIWVIIGIMLLVVLLTGCGDNSESSETKQTYFAPIEFKEIEVKTIETETILYENVITETILYEDVTTYWD